MQTKPIQFYSKAQAAEVTGGCSQTTKMPCLSYELPTEACVTGSKLAKVEGSICSTCYANKGNYARYAKTIKPAQFKRLESLNNPDWVPAMIKLIGSSTHFRWHSSGDIQNLGHLEKIAAIAEALPDTLFWLPTREYAIVKAFITKHGKLPQNLTVRLSALFVDQPVKIPASLAKVSGIVVSNVHAKAAAVGIECAAPKQNGECRECRACWDPSIAAVSYHVH